MRKLKLEIDALQVESFEAAAEGSAAGTVRGYLTAYYELCQPGDTWQQTCSCDPTCNNQTCYNCGTGGTGGTGGATGGAPTCTGACFPVDYTVAPTSCQPECR